MKRRRSTTVSLARVAPGVLGAAILLTSAAPAGALQIGSEVCADVEAYASKLGKAERKRREEEARQQAITKLARRVLIEAWQERSEPAPTDETLESLRLRYGVAERLQGGEFRPEGDKNQKRISYCIARDRYKMVRKDLSRQREQTIADLRRRFAEVEESIDQGDLESASEALTPLEIEVVGENLNLTSYESVLDRRKRPFYVWLFEWGDTVTRGAEYVRAMTNRATESIELGHLEEADRYVAEALKADREDTEARELRATIQQRRNRRVDLLGEAERFAEAGRFAAARSNLDEARSIGNDDLLPLEETAGTINALYAEYVQYNPKVGVMAFMALGTLGVDTSEIERRVFDETGSTSEGSAVLGVGAGGQFRLGRFMVVGVTGSWGLSQDDARFSAGESVELYEVYQLSAGVGYRTRRSAKRKVSFQLTGGPVLESVKINSDFSGTLSTSDSQVALFVRLLAEWPHGGFFVQHGLGFEDNPDSLVGWSNRLQVGAAIVF